MDLSSVKTKGQFKWRSVYNLRVSMRRCQLLTSITETDNEFTFSVRINEEALQRLQLLENKLRSALAKDNSYLKGQLVDNNTLNLKLWSTKKGIKTNIYALNGSIILYSDLKAGDFIDINFVVESLWSHQQYYPNYIYKLKAEEIYACE